MRDIPPTATAVGLLMAGTTIGLASIDRSSDGSNLGLLLCIAGIAILAVTTICKAVRGVNRPADEAYHDGWEAGYDKGWRDGQGATRPQIVQFPATAVRIAAADELNPPACDSAGI